jgi:hypothetical protein
LRPRDLRDTNLYTHIVLPCDEAIAPDIQDALSRLGISLMRYELSAIVAFIRSFDAQTFHPRRKKRRIVLSGTPFITRDAA